MKFCQSTLFESGRALFIKNFKIYSSKTSTVFTAVKAVRKLISSHLKNRHMADISVSQNRLEVSCSLRFSAFT